MVRRFPVRESPVFYWHKFGAWIGASDIRSSVRNDQLVTDRIAAMVYEGPLHSKNDLLRRKRRLLNFEEMLGTRTGWEQFASYFQSERLDVIDNTPEEIDELVLEMLNSTAGPENVTAPEDQRLRDAYNDFAVSHGSYSGASMGLAFLRKYADWLPRKKLSLADSNDTGRMQARVTMGRRNIKI